MLSTVGRGQVTPCQAPCDQIEVMLSRQPDFLVVEIVDHDGMAIL